MNEWNKEAKRVGVRNMLKQKSFDLYYRMRLFRINVRYPDFSGNAVKTNALSFNRDAVENQPSSFHSLLKAFKQIPIERRAVRLFDIGCGCGRVLNFGMLLGFREVAGVELHSQLLKPQK